MLLSIQSWADQNSDRPFFGRVQNAPSTGGSHYSRSPSPHASPDVTRPPVNAAKLNNVSFSRDRRLPSPDLGSNMDCAFPPFPTSRSRTPDPTSNDGPKLRYGAQNPYAGPSALYSPLDAKPLSSPSVLQRMDTIAPGPFDGRPSEDRYDPKSPGRVPSSKHRRTATASSVRESLRSTSSEKRGHTRQASAAISNRSLGSTTSLPSDVSGSVPSTDIYGPRNTPPRSTQPSGDIDSFLRDMSEEGTDPAVQQISSASRSRTFPIRKDSEDDVGFQAPAPARNRPAAMQHSRRPSLPSNPRSAVPEAPMTPRTARNAERSRKLNLFEPSSNVRNRSGSQSGIRTDIRLDNAPPIPVAPPSQPPLRIQSSNLRRHDSSSSSGSDGRKDGLVSTPLTSASSSMSSTASSAELFGKPSALPARPSTGHGRKPSFGNAQHFQSLNALTGVDNPPPAFNRSNPPPPLEPFEQSPIVEGPESPMDPAIQRGLFSPPKSSKASKPTRATPQFDSKPLPAAPELRSDPPAMQRRPTMKGNCRGCGEIITGKSIKAADGRLSGRYHKQCFVCQTCRFPFATASFYVIADQPYCEHDYHTLNDSLCHSCNRGIEGQYLETEARQKFHPKCLTCNTCRKVLSQDYFEVGDGVFCERHAFAQVPGPGAFLGAEMGKGRRNPERRTTRLMMM